MSNSESKLGIIKVDAGRYLITHFIRATKTPASEVEEVSSADVFRLVSLADDGQGDAEPASYEGTRTSEQLDETPAWIYIKERKFCLMSDVQDLVNARLPSLAVQVRNCSRAVQYQINNQSSVCA